MNKSDKLLLNLLNSFISSCDRLLFINFLQHINLQENNNLKEKALLEPNWQMKLKLDC